MNFIIIKYCRITQCVIGGRGTLRIKTISSTNNHSFISNCGYLSIWVQIEADNTDAYICEFSRSTWCKQNIHYHIKYFIVDGQDEFNIEKNL